MHTRCAQESVIASQLLNKSADLEITFRIDSCYFDEEIVDYRVL